MANVLVIGGAGYIGSAVCAWLIDRGHRVSVVDDLSTGHRELLLGHEFVQGRAGDAEILKSLLKSQTFDCAMHFAAFSPINACFDKHSEYFENNCTQTESLVETLLAYGVKRLVFSSSGAVFGDSGHQLVTEVMGKNPTNPYGLTKLKGEEFLAETSNLRSISLRYFNAAGAEPQLRVGEWHEPETHLIPLSLRAAMSGQVVPIFGDDYPTADGTCVRDYVHVWDLAAAHESAMLRILESTQTGFEAFNLGSERGYSVREIIGAVERATGHHITTAVRPRRRGDVPHLVANSLLAQRCLGFQPKHSQLDRIIGSAWAWEKKLMKLRGPKNISFYPPNPRDSSALDVS